MTGAVALAVVLVIAVAGLSLAMQSQRTAQSTQSPRPPRAPRPPVAPRRTRDRRTPPPAPAETSATPDPVEPESQRGPDLLRSGEPAQAKVISVVDERTIGPVTRSRLTLQIDPGDGATFEVTTRVAFATPAARARIKVGGTVPVRYDKDDRTRIVVDLPAD
jgi:hypothetical protein